MPIDKEKIIIGVIHVGDVTDGYSYAHDFGIKQMQEALELRDDQIISKFNIGESDPHMAEFAIEECIEMGANIIFATSWGYMDVCEQLANEHPNVIFAHASGYKYNSTNFTNYFGRIYQARYLSGVAAGLLTKTDKLGYVAAMGKSNSEVTSGLNAFALGVESVNPQASVYVKVTNTWFDPSAERNAASKLIGEGCDVIAQHCDSAAAQIEAQKKGVWGIGYNSDMSIDAQEAVLTSVVWNWGVYYTYIVKSVIEASFTTEPYFGGLAEGLVDITELNETLSTERIAKAVEDTRESILKGEINVFDGIMKTNAREKIGHTGTTLSDLEIRGGIGWYYHNIIEIK